MVADPQLNRLLDRALPYLPRVLLVTLNVALVGVSALATLNALATRPMPEETAHRIDTFPSLQYNGFA